MNLAGTVLYVADIPKSVAFYRDLFEREPVHLGDVFALFELEGGQLRLWQQEDVEPAVPDAGKLGTKGGCELAFGTGGEEALQRLFDKVTTMADVIQAPRQLSFGKAFTALDPDGHRLRFMHVER